MKRYYLSIFFIVPIVFGAAQNFKTKNIVFVTLDGLRWQEIFKGADSVILRNREYSNGVNLKEKFWSPDEKARREILFPFLWSTIAKEGQLYGNREYGNKVNCANPYWFSYPGYSELLAGYVDRGINSNRNVENPNSTVLEFIKKQEGFKNRIAVFSTWETISYIAREQTSGIPVLTGLEYADEIGLSDRKRLLNEVQEIMPDYHGTRCDALTFCQAWEYMKINRPRVIFISFNETDQSAHGGHYDKYLTAAHKTDEMLGRLWNWIQSQDDYCDQTTMIVTTDHGRGKGKNNWRTHGRLAFGSDQTWMMVIGPDTPHVGEMKTSQQIYLKQVASTVASLLGFHYHNERQVGRVVESVSSDAQLANIKIYNVVKEK